MRLPQYAVGFWDACSEPFPEVDPQALASLVHGSARPSGVWIEHVDPLAYPRSFHVIRLKSRTEQYDLLCLQHLAWVGFCHSAPDSMGFDTDATFREPPPWSNLLAENGYRVLTGSELALRYSEIDLSELTEVARSSCRYWKPDTLAAILFNWWD
ncbi:hypothetical protein [Glycomyces xiaoerkulensis]|uniref:hypothetical protein n=1 Tax=Glycomyces xiaoerkulensis TaxID=2038139 RepID=UPI000C26970A|nr:hypothetical protein [Glycomyces xiaoerkulensis]